MKQFEKWYADERKRRVGAPMYSADYRTGWKAALEWVLNNRKPYYDIEDKKVVATDSNIIYKELEK